MNYLQWITFLFFFTMGFGIGYIRGFDAGQVKGYLRGRSVNRHISQLVK